MTTNNAEDSATIKHLQAELEKKNEKIKLLEAKIKCLEDNSSLGTQGNERNSLDPNQIEEVDPRDAACVGGNKMDSKKGSNSQPGHWCGPEMASALPGTGSETEENTTEEGK